MKVVYLVALLGGTVSYSILLLLMIYGLNRLFRKIKRLESLAPERIRKEPFLMTPVSIVIAAKDEEAYIQATLESLLQQDYPSENLEIIVVDDRSGDNTAEIVRHLQSKHPNLKLIQQTTAIPNLSPKKQALAVGINASTTEFILTTDADCKHPSTWVKNLISHFEADTGMVVGQVRFARRTGAFWQNLQAIDYQAQMVGAAGLVEAGAPFNCSGASLAFRRAAYLSVGGYSGLQHLISGDDELLMAKMSRYGWRIIAATGKDCVVATEPPHTLKELWHQRVRWASKGIHYSPFRTLLLSGVFLFYLTLILTPLCALTNVNWLFPLSAFGWKLILDYIVLKFGKNLYNDSFHIVEFFCAEIIHPPFIVAVSLVGHFGTFRWKNIQYLSGQTQTYV